jgi:hypothetical protein
MAPLESLTTPEIVLWADATHVNRQSATPAAVTANLDVIMKILLLDPQPCEQKLNDSPLVPVTN